MRNSTAPSMDPGASVRAGLSMPWPVMARHPSTTSASPLALNYAGTRLQASSATLGVNTLYDIALASGTLTPSFKASYTRQFSGDIRQHMNYIDPVATSQTLQLASEVQGIASAGIGLAWRRRDGLQLELDYLGSLGDDHYRENALAVQVMMMFCGGCATGR